MLNDKQAREVITLFGEQNQILVAIEELAELQKELTKSLRVDVDYLDSNALLEEIADITIMLKQLMVLFEFNQLELDEMIDLKLFRLKGYIQQVQGYET